MSAEKHFNGPGVRLAGIGRGDGLLKREKLFTGADSEAIVRQRDDIGFPVAREMESNRQATWTGVRRIVRDGRVRRPVREANGDGHRSSLEMRGFGNGRCVFRGCERSLADNPLGMDRAITRLASRQTNHKVEDLLGDILVARRFGGSVHCLCFLLFVMVQVRCSRAFIVSPPVVRASVIKMSTVRLWS